MTSADGFLHLLAAEPTLLDPAPAHSTSADHDRRRAECRACLRCGAVAECVFVAELTAGPRWLDLCMPCTEWLRRGITPGPMTPSPDELGGREP